MTATSGSTPLSGLGLLWTPTRAVNWWYPICANLFPRLSSVDGGITPWMGILGISAETDELYEAYLKTPVLSFCGDRVNGTVMAYGQTGAGKTHTIQGLIPYVLRDLLENVPFTALSFSLVEVYGDELRDLFFEGNQKTRKPLTIADGNGKAPVVVGAKRLKVQTLEEVLELYQLGTDRRTSAETAMNLASSRSHSVFSIFLDSPEYEEESVLNIVDLAGSERQKRTLNVGMRFKESININSGLLALGNVIRALVENREHVPYRACKLTRLLQGALGGNSRTVFIACVAPNRVNTDETIRTLQYSCKAMQIVNHVHPAAQAHLEEQQQRIDEQTRRLRNEPDPMVAHEEYVQAAATILTLQKQVTSLKTALLVAQENLNKDELIFAEKFKVLKRLHRENASLKHRVQCLETKVQQQEQYRAASKDGRKIVLAQQEQIPTARRNDESPPTSRHVDPAAIIHRPVMVSIAVGPDCPSPVSLQQLAHQDTPPEQQQVAAVAAGGTGSRNKDDISPLYSAIHAQINTIACKYETACDVVGGIPSSPSEMSKVQKDSSPPPFVPVSPSKKLDFSSSSSEESGEVSILKSNNAVLHLQLQKMIKQNENLTKENAALSKELEEVAMLVSGA